MPSVRALALGSVGRMGPRTHPGKRWFFWFRDHSGKAWAVSSKDAFFVL